MLKKTFYAYGLRPARYINQSINLDVLKRSHCYASKNAKLFGIDLHIDDLIGVGMEGEKYGFETLIIGLDDKD